MAEQYGRLTLFGEPFYKKRKNGKNLTWVKAICDCGKSGEFPMYRLKNGHTKSCGCGKIGNHRTHGLTNHPLYAILDNMEARCYNQNLRQYKDYGGRGISVCDEWRGNHKAFYDWSINNGWKKGLHLDRRNNNGNYEPSNCRFVDLKTNARNKRNTRLNDARVMVIRNLYNRGVYSMTELGSIYGISRGHVGQVVRNIIWT